MDLIRDGSSHGILQCEDVREFPIIAFRPKIRFISDLNQVYGDPHATGFPANAALDEVIGAQLSADLVHREVGAILHALQSDAAEATGKVLTVGQQLQRSNLPDASEISNLIRNAPRFAMPERQGEISLGGWTLLGSEGARRRLLSALRTSVEPVLEQELRAYSAALGRWAKETSRDLRFILESFAEGYRTSLQQAQSPGDDIIQFAETRNAIASLL